MAKDKESPWVKYRDGLGGPVGYRYILELAGEELIVDVYRCWEVAAQNQPAFGLDEIRVLKSTGLEAIPPDMVRAIMAVKQVLGGAITEARPDAKKDEPLPPRDFGWSREADEEAEDSASSVQLSLSDVPDSEGDATGRGADQGLLF